MKLQIADLAWMIIRDNYISSANRVDDGSEAAGSFLCARTVLDEVVLPGQDTIA